MERFGLNLKRVIRKIVLLVLVFVLAAGGFAAYQFYIGEQTDSYEVMGSATLPLVSLTYLDEYSNVLHGYTEEMELTAMRGPITPLTREHKISIVIREAEGVDQVSYEVRGLDGTRLVEDGAVGGWQTEDGVMATQLQFSNLVDNANEYQLILRLDKQGQSIYYYSRIIYLEEGHTESLIGFARSFMEAASQGNTDFVVNYIQPDDTMGTTDFSYVNQHSRSGMITWKGLGLTVSGAVQTTLTELTDSQASVTLVYPVDLTYEDSVRHCTVTEQYVVRFRDDVLYLLDFERHVKEDFSCVQPVFDGSTLVLGITSQEPQQEKSPDGNIQVYLYDGEMFACNTKENCFELIYTYKDGNDERALWDHYQLQTVQVEDSGDIYFMVYGYHNRGNHEGKVGVSFLHYIKESRKIDEIFFIPVSFSEEVLLQNMGTLAYVNGESDLMYLLYGHTVYSIDLSSGEKVELAVASGAGSFYSSEGSSIIGWEEGDQRQYPDTICVADLRNGQTYRIQAEEGEFLQIQGFLNDDLVYCIGRISDVISRAGEVLLKPMYSLKIATFDDEMTEAGEYTPSGYYIEKTELLENQIEVYRVVKSGDTFESAENDQLFLNDRESSSGMDFLKTQIADGFQKIAAIRLDVDAETLTADVRSCEIRDSAAAYQLNLSDASQELCYYVYSKGGLSLITSSLSAAIDLAYSEMGCVVDGSGSYIWTRGTRALNKLLTFQEETAAGENDSLRACLDILVTYEGGKTSLIEDLLSQGISPAELINQCMGVSDDPSSAASAGISGSKTSHTGSAQNLRGCTISQILYYINENHPVLAVTGDDSAVLLVGYDTQNISIYNPVTGETSTVTQADAAAYFIQYDSNFVCWLD